MKKFTREAHGKHIPSRLNSSFSGLCILIAEELVLQAAAVINQLQKDLDAAKDDAEYASSHHQAGIGVLAYHLQEKAKLKDKTIKQAQEIGSLKTQLLASQDENRKIKETLFDKGFLTGPKH